MDYIICHYGEIALKGKNRRFFEERLVENIKRVLKPAQFTFIKRISGRIIIKLTQEGTKKEKEVSKALKNIFGIANFSFATSSPQKIKDIQENAFSLLRNAKFETFRISTKRSKKDFLLNSQQINEKVGKYILQKTANSKQRTKVKVDLERPDINCFIEIVEKYAFLYTKKIKGLRGLPIGVSGKAISLLSGGIDSPVASFFGMKRGIKVIFVHFHAYPYTSEASIEKVKKIAEILNKYQGKSKLYLIPFGEIQREVLLKTVPKLRVILYRRFMFKISQEIAGKEKAGAIITGESVGQVASQTLENIRAIEEVVSLPVLRPLIAHDKEEIINKAKKINAYSVSILPDEDCCSRFLPAHPSTKANLKEVKQEENKLNTNKLVKEAIRKAIPVYF